MAAKPEMCSLNMGSMNFGLFPMLDRYKEFKYEWEREHLENSRDFIFRNTFKDIELILKEVGDGCGTRFEFECYDVGHLYTLAHFLDRGLVKPPLFVQTIFGILGGIGADPENLQHMKRIADKLFGDDYYWSVLGFCSEDEYQEFMRSCPEFERMLVRSGIILIKYWFSVSDEEQERRFQSRLKEPHKRWKLSPMDLQSRAKWVEYSRAKDDMFAHTDIKQAPWFVVKSDNKKLARLNCIKHLLSMIPYEDLTPEPIRLPKRQSAEGYVRPPMSDQTFVPDYYE